MASETITLTDTCAGGGHLTFTLTGAKAGSALLYIDELAEPISDDDMAIFCKCIAKLAKAGRTNAQTRTLLQAGVTVTV